MLCKHNKRKRMCRDCLPPPKHFSSKEQRMRDTEFVSPVLGLSDDFKYSKIGPKLFEKMNPPEKICAVQNANQCGEYMYNYFMLDGAVRYFHSETDYWTKQSEKYMVKEVVDYVWEVKPR